MPARLGLKDFLWSATIACAALLPCAAFATLGEPESSVLTDSQALQGSSKATDHGSYRVHEIQLPSGTLLREYASLDGTVFAVTWHGPFMPNLRQTLGRYFDEYATAPKSLHTDHNHLQIKLDDLVVQSSGHMRAYTGRAYLPQAIPDGVTLGDLQ